MILELLLGFKKLDSYKGNTQRGQKVKLLLSALFDYRTLVSLLKAIPVK